MSIIREVNLGGSSEVRVNNTGIDPIPVNLDRIYGKGLNQDYCDIDGFTGEITDFFEDLKTTSINTSTDNPKVLKFWLNRTTRINQIGFGCDDLGYDFSNIVFKALGSGEEVRYTKDLSSDSTKRNSYLLELPDLALNGFIIEFHTVDPVGLSNLVLFKVNSVLASLQASNPDDDVVPIGASDSGNLKITDAESGLAIAKGEVVGSTFIHKFGGAPDFDEGDGQVTIWDGADDSGIDEMLYNYSTTNDIDSLSSDSASDTVDIEVQGLDVDYNVVVQTVTLTGQTRVALTTPLMRVFRLKNVGSVNLVGDVYCYVNTAISGGVPVDTTKVRAIIHFPNNQTLMAVYTIPAGYTGYMRDWYAATAGSSKDSNYPIRLMARPLGQVFQLKHIAALSDSGTSQIQHKYEEPEVFAEKTDIELRAAMLATGGTGAAVAGGFDIVLVANV
jgi:hypothetical protein